MFKKHFNPEPTFVKNIKGKLEVNILYENTNKKIFKNQQIKSSNIVKR